MYSTCAHLLISCVDFDLTKLQCSHLGVLDMDFYLLPSIEEEIYTGVEYAFVEIYSSTLGISSFLIQEYPTS